MSDREFDWGRALTAFGGGDVGALDAERKRRQEYPLQEQMNKEKISALQASTASENEKTLALRASTEAEKEKIASIRNSNEDAKRSSAQAESWIDPTSSESRNEQNRYARDMNALASTPGIPKSFSDYLKSASAQSADKSGAQLARERSSIDNIIGHIFAGQKSASSAAETAARISGGYFDKSYRNNPQLKLSHDQNKLVGEMANDMAQEKSMDQLGPELDALQQRDKGKWYKPDISGPVSGKIQSLMSMFESTSDPERNKFAANLQRLFSVERKTFAGVSVTPQEMQNLAPMIPDLSKDSEQTIKDKLSSSREWLKNRRQTQLSRLQFDMHGHPIDASALVSALSSGTNIPAAVSADPVVERTRQMSVEKPKGISSGKAQPGTKPGTIFKSPSTGRTFVVQPDMTLKEK